MSLSNFTADVSFISKLDNDPSDDRGMTPALLKERFDAGSNTIKNFLNSTLIPELNSEIAGKLSAGMLMSALAEAKASGDFDGRNAQLRMSGEFIEWRTEGVHEWEKLFSLADLRGERGYPGIAVETSGIFAFTVSPEGHLILSYTGDDAPGLSINEGGHLIFSF